MNALSSAITTQTPKIIQSWLRRARSEIQGAENLSDKILTNHLPDYLRDVGRIFANAPNPDLYFAALKRAEDHGAERARSGVYTVAQVIVEYTILREVLVAQLASESPLLSSADYLTLTRVFEGSIGASVARYASEHRESLQIDAHRLAQFGAAANARVTRDFLAPTKFANEGAKVQQVLKQQASELAGEELARVFEQAPFPIALMSGPEHIFRLANPPYLAYIDRDPIGQPVRQVFSPLEANHFLAALDQVYQTGVPFVGNDMNFDRAKSDGSVEQLKVDVVFNPFRDFRGEITGVLAFIYDITEQSNARTALVQSESRLRSMFAHAAVGFAISDIHGRFLQVNSRFCEICGYSEAELLKLSTLDLIHPDERVAELARLQSLLEGNETHFILEKRIVRKDGVVVCIRNSVSTTRGPHGERLTLRVAEDVSDAREAERRRKESEVRYVRLAESMPQIVWTTLPNGDLDYANQVWFTYSGTRLEDNLGRGWMRAIHPDDLAEFEAHWIESLETGIVFESEMRLRGRLGHYRWFVARAVPARGADGEIEQWFGTHTDIHASKVLQNELEQAKREVEAEQIKFKTIFADSATSMAVLQGPEFVYEIANRSYLELFNNRDILGKPFLVALPELAGQAFPRHAQEVYTTGKPYIDREARAFLQRTDGGPLEERFFDQTYTRMLDREGQSYGVFIHAIEVTDRVRSRREIELIADRLRMAVDLANIGTWELDVKTNIVDWSDRTRIIFGFSPDVVNVETVIERIHPDDRPRVVDAIAAALSPTGSDDYNIEYRIAHPTGEIRWLSLIGRALFEDTPEGRVCVRFSGTVLDITDRVLAESALREAKEKAETANAAKSAFLANMSHEIRTPLGAIMGFVSLIKEEELNQQMLLNYVSVIERNSVQLMRIIDDILDLSKVEAGMMLIEHIEFSLIELLSDFSSLMGFRSRERGILFELKAKTELPNIVNTDPTRMRQILTNIVGNAIKFTERGSVQLFVSYADEMLSFEVQDTGRGITPEQARHLFQPFSQGDVSTTRKFGGTGLGLVLTRRLSEALGGSFELTESIPGQGTTFTARVGAKKVPQTSMVKALGFASEPIRNAGMTARLRDLRVLLVEDSPDNQALYSIYLSLAGAKIDIASDGAHGYQMALGDKYDVVLMDVQMPIMDGITAVKKLREHGYQVPIIALTAHAMKEERVRCIEAGYNDFLSKPVQRAELIETLKRYMKDAPPEA